MPADKLLTKKDFEYVYQLLEDVTPLYGDCGELCDKECCTDWDKEVGMYLLPGEEIMFTGQEDWLVFEKHNTEDYEFPPGWEGEFYFVRCTKPCPRGKRPFECRTFPLIPYYDQKSDSFELILNPNGIMICPLIKYSEIEELNPEFLENVEEAWSILLTNPMIKEDIIHKSSTWDKDPEWRNFFTK
ncbi:MAG: hypothetical protein KAX49_04800 [Halanaerobiales bacterium]|nr:hypothetical protein [Halanaerobiales bacterium]